MDVLDRLSTKTDRKMVIKYLLPRRKIISLKVKVALTLRNDCSPEPRARLFKTNDVVS